jgi:nitrous oxide reductase accessory protein NosL
LYYPDGEVYQTCSGHCAALIVANKKAEPDKTEAYAYDLDKMINVKEAFFVVGADIIPENSMYPSVFSFSDEKKALDFQKSHGGKLTDFNGVLETGKKKD